MLRDQLEALAIKPISSASVPVRQRAGLHGWIQRGMIALAVIWLLVGVILPLGELLGRATTIEIPVSIEIPTEQEKLKDDFRGEIRVGERNILLMQDDGRTQLYIDNNTVETRSGRYQADDLTVTCNGESILSVQVNYVPAGRFNDGTLQSIKPIRIQRTDHERWRIDGHYLPIGEQVRVITRYIGLANFMAYFGFRGIGQIELLVSILLTIAAGILLVRLIHQYWRLRRTPASPEPTRNNLMLPIGLLLLAQIVRSANHIASAASSGGLASSAWNSLTVALVTTVISMTLAFIYAYALTRTCMPGKQLLKVVAMLPLFAPTMLYGLSLVYLFGNQGILTTGFFDFIPWIAFDIDLYGFRGIVIAEVAFTFPAAMMILSVALSNTDARLYEAAAVMGSGSIRTFFTVTLPGVKYGLLSAMFVCFTLAFTDFGAPKVVGGQFNVLAVDIYKQVVGQQNFGMGATVSLILLAPTLLAFVADRIIQRRSHAALSARSVPLQPKPAWRRDLTFLLLSLVIALAILSVLFTAGIASFVTIWPYAFTHPDRYPQLWTLAHYTFEHVGGGGFRAFNTSLRMAAYTALFGTVITFVSAYLIEKTRDADWLRQSAYLFSMIPLALPGLVIGIAYVFFFNRPVFEIPFTGIQFTNPFLPLYGTMALLVLSNVIHFYTVSFLTATTALRQLDKEFEVVAESMGVPFYKTFLRVTVPVCFPAVIEIAAYYFVSAMATVSAVIFLYNSRLPLASVAVVNMDDAGDTAAAAAMCMLIVAANVGVRLLAEGICALFARKTQTWRKR